MDEIITEKLSLWAKEGIEDSTYMSMSRKRKKKDKAGLNKHRIAKNNTQNSISKQLRLF